MIGRSVAAAVVLVLAACGSDGEAASPSTSTSTATPSVPSTSSAAPTEDPCAADDLRPLAGFGEVVVRVAAPDAEPADHCMLLAATIVSMQLGLMEQQDLRGYAGMVFRHPEPSESGFHMRNTRIPLSIAFFDEAGRFVSAADMEPCPDTVEDCPSYRADAPYLHAIEVAEGDLPALGLVEGSTISFPT